MALKKVLLISVLLVASFAYWLYEPLPDGYSPASATKIRLFMASFKLLNVAVKIGEALGFDSSVNITKSLGKRILNAKPGPQTDDILTVDAVFDGVPVRIYRPKNLQNEILPAIVYYHGGGFTLGSLELSDGFTRIFSRETNAVVISVEYRLAPEWVFPAAFDDCVTATKYLLTNAAEYRVDPNRVAVSGDSAGGNLAAAVSLKLRDEQFAINIRLQVLIYPTLQGLDFNLPSNIQNANGPLLTRDMMTFFTGMYIDGNLDRQADYLANRHVSNSYRRELAKTYLNLEKLPKSFLEGYVKPAEVEGRESVWNEIKDRMLNPYYSPLVASNLEDLPEAYIFTGHYDPIRDDGWLYGVRLQEANNKVTMFNCESAFHGVLSIPGAMDIPEAFDMFRKITAFIVQNLRHQRLLLLIDIRHLSKKERKGQGRRLFRSGTWKNVAEIDVTKFFPLLLLLRRRRRRQRKNQ